MDGGQLDGQEVMVTAVKPSRGDRMRKRYEKVSLLKAKLFYESTPKILLSDLAHLAAGVGQEDADVALGVVRDHLFVSGRHQPAGVEIQRGRPRLTAQIESR